MKKVTIVGAGFSGMSLAYFLNKHGAQVEIYEKQSEVGGIIKTPTSIDGFYETAANGFLTTGLIEEFLNDIQAQFQPAAKISNKKYIFRGKPKRFPLNIFEAARFAFDIIKFLLKNKSQRRPFENESIENWTLRHFQKVVLDYLVTPALQGIYAGDVSRLSASLILDRFFRVKQVNTKKRTLSAGLISSKNGMTSLMNELAEYLKKSGVKFNLNQQFDFVNWQKNVLPDQKLVIATSASQAIEILKNMNTPESVFNAEIIEGSEFIPLVTVTCFLKTQPKDYQGFGILFPPGENFQALGVLMNDLIFDRKQKNHTETWIFGGALNKEFHKKTEDEILKIIVSERKKIFTDSDNISSFKVTKWSENFIHYSTQHEQNLKKMKSMNNVILHGNYLGSLGLSRILEKSQQIALDIKK